MRAFTIPDSRLPVPVWAASVLMAVIASAHPAQAQVQTEKPPIPLTAEQDVKFHELLPDLRCLVCQNESLADSTAPLAQDLKYEVRGLVAQGKSEREIKKYLTDRYGDFVLFKPPFDARTALIWLGPVLFVLIGVAMVVRQARRRRAGSAPVVDRAALDRLLDDGKP